MSSRAVRTGNRLTPSDIAAAALTLETGEPPAAEHRACQPAEWQFHPSARKRPVIAALGLARDDGAPPIDDGPAAACSTSLLDQVALALERARLEGRRGSSPTLRERDRLRSALLGIDRPGPGRACRDRRRRSRTAARRHRRQDARRRRSIPKRCKLERYISNLVELDPASDQRPVDTGGVTIDLFQRAVSQGRREVHLTPKEYAVLAELAKHPGRVLTHAHLLRTAWGPAQEAQTEYLRVAVRALRQKLERNPARPEIIINEPAVGYRLVVEQPETQTAPSLG